MCSYCIVIVILYCPPKEVFLCRNFLLGPRKSVRCKEVSGKSCPLHRGFLIRILYETNPFLEKVSARRRCPLWRMSAIERFHCSIKIRTVRDSTKSMKSYLCDMCMYVCMNVNEISSSCLDSFKSNLCILQWILS